MRDPAPVTVRIVSAVGPEQIMELIDSEEGEQIILSLLRPPEQKDDA